MRRQSSALENCDARSAGRRTKSSDLLPFSGRGIAARQGTEAVTGDLWYPLQGLFALSDFHVIEARHSPALEVEGDHSVLPQSFLPAVESAVRTPKVPGNGRFRKTLLHQSLVDHGLEVATEVPLSCLIPWCQDYSPADVRPPLADSALCKVGRRQIVVVPCHCRIESHRLLEVHDGRVILSGLQGLGAFRVVEAGLNR